MITFSLQSGSNGNAIFVEAGGVRLLFDAGISGRCAQGRMRLRCRDMREVDALLISHDHADHVRSAGVFHRLFNIPVYMTRRTLAAVPRDLGRFTALHHFDAGQTLSFGPVRVHTLPTPHDAADGVGFVVEHDGRRLGILTDLGHPFAALRETLVSLQAVYLESNYDPFMLENGPYPLHLQERIRGAAGHISNEESARLIRESGARLEWVALAHLSEENNEPGLALQTCRRIVGPRLPLHVATRYDVGPLLEL